MISKSVGGGTPFLDQSNFDKLLKERLRPNRDLTGLELLRSLAKNERDARVLYRNRAPYELLQNADDVGARKAVFILTEEGLAFVHDGTWFTVDNFKNLAKGWSDKNPNECIGHKGLGFRSVLDITPDPHVIQANRDNTLAIKFSWSLNNGHINETLREKPDLKSEYIDWTKHGEICCPIMHIPKMVKKASLSRSLIVALESIINGYYDGKHTTIFWFPASDPDIPANILEDLDPVPIISDQEGEERLLTFLENEVSVLLPFLASIERVSIFKERKQIGSAEVQKREQTKFKEGEINVVTEIRGKKTTNSFYQLTCRVPIPQDIKNKPYTPRAIKYMTNARLTLSVKIKNGQPICDYSSRFHVYFPTEEFTGMGFVIHGDFSVKPDRTRLSLPSGYNEWLLEVAASTAASEFLTKLLNTYKPDAVFAALSPTGYVNTDAAKKFEGYFSEKLRDRTEPFIPTRFGLLRQQDVLLPPSVDEDGFWDSHFSEVVPQFDASKKAFLLCEADNKLTRNFLRLTDVRTIDTDDILTFIELFHDEEKSPEWWYWCYEYMANNNDISNKDRAYFEGRKIIPCENFVVLSPGDKSGTVICLSPQDHISIHSVPLLFSNVFTFLDHELAQLLDENDKVSHWVLDKFRIARFEASELLPRAVRKVAPDIFNGNIKVKSKDLIDAWIFIEKVITSSRVILSESFWSEIGRFPVPIVSLIDVNQYMPTHLRPAFLSYWPDSLLEGNNCLTKLNDLRRVDETFFHSLIEESKLPAIKWKIFFDKIGISNKPKILKYRRIIGRGTELPIDLPLSEDINKTWFSGERQSDENIAVIKALKVEEKLWNHWLSLINLCDHNSKIILQALTVIEGFSLCVQTANAEYAANDSRWQDRLWSLVKGMYASLPESLDVDSLFCHAGRDGHSIGTQKQYIRMQFEYYNWLPSSRGPASINQCYLRQSTRRLISKGRSDDEIGDKLLPYMVVDSFEEISRLEKIGIVLLDDAASAKSNVLIRALKDLGDILSSEWGEKSILSNRGQWRLVRGAIQEIYSSLNKADSELAFPEDFKIATKSSKGITFTSLPVYYSEPGSAIEMAFINKIKLIDSDRLNRNLWRRMGVIRLSSEDSVIEELEAENISKSCEEIREEIVTGLAPYFLALIKAKVDKSKHDELIMRRLKDRFEVRMASPLSVRFTLKDEPSISSTVDFPKFYLHKKRVKGVGVIEEFHYVLYINNDKGVSLLTLDADALGTSISPLFLDGINDDLSSDFPRIASRYQLCKGQPEQMEEFLYHQIGVSKESQESAKDMTNEITPDFFDIPPPPPPVQIIDHGSKESSPDASKRLQEMMKKHHQGIDKKTDKLFKNLGGNNKQGIDKADMPEDIPDVEFITPEQQERGKKGEEEIKRRFLLPGGWQGFSLKMDTRNVKCGYDFLCTLDNRDVKVEVKTFSRNGRIIVTSLELQAAADDPNNYYLVGVLDENGINNKSETYVIRDPLEILIAKGEFKIQTKVSMQASEVFDIKFG